MAEKKVRPLTRQELMPQLVTDADAFTALRYIRQREAVPALPELAEKGQEVLPGSEGVLADLYDALWDPEPSLKKEVAPDRRYWKQLLGQTIETSAYQELHAGTQLKELQSVLGTIAMGESVLALVPKKDQEQLKELQEASQEAEDADGAASQAEANAQVAQMLADAATKQSAGVGQSGQSQSGKPSGKPGSGKGQMSSEQAQKIANELAKAAAKAQNDAKAARDQADEKQFNAEIQADELLGQPGSDKAEKKLRELTRIGLQAIKGAQAKVEEVSETIEAWGLEEGELCRKGMPEALALLQRMKRSEALKKFAGLLGRLRKIAARKARAKAPGEGVRITVPETGRDIRRAHVSELVALASPALRVKALTRWARGELRLVGQKTRQKLGHGPVIVCEDGSGSMDGAKQQWAKGVTLSLAHYAKLQKRSFGWVLFDNGVRQSKSYPHGQLSAEQMLELAESRAGGGTNFEVPLRKAMEMIQKEGLKKADICFITDGDCAVSDEFLREFLAVKKAHEINVFTVLCDVGSTSDTTVQKFSDRVVRVSSFTAEEAETAVFGSL